MTPIQAILLGGIYWLYVNEIGSGFNYSFFCYPSTACLWYGLILGDMETALICGATIAPLFLGYAAVGAIVSTDKAAACLIPTAAVICYGMDLNIALALSVPVGLLMAQMHILKRTIGSVYIRRAERIIEKDNCNSRKLFFNGVVIPSLVKVVLFWLPMSLICYFGLQTFSSVVDSIPAWLKSGLSAVGMVMPALGMGLLLNVIGERKLFPYFLAGFFLAQYTGAGNIALVLVALFLAWLYMNNNKVDLVELEADAGGEEGKLQPILKRRDVIGAYIRWMAFNEVPSSYERHMGYGVLMSLLPPLKKLYKDRPEELKDACLRHLQFFNTEQFWGACVPGIALAMEEQKALGAPITGESIESVKIGLMGPLAGIGDTINWATFTPLILTFFIPYALEGHVWAAVLPMLIIFGVVFLEGYILFPLGYRVGTKAAASLLSSGKIKNLLLFLGVLGMFMVGALSAGFVNVTTPIVIGSGEGAKVLQEQLDSIIPGILSLLIILGVFGFLQKKGRKAIMACMLILLIGSILLGCLGMLG